MPFPHGIEFVYKPLVDFKCFGLAFEFKGNADRTI